jgi:uncharacterized protein YoxC
VSSLTLWIVALAVLFVAVALIATLLEIRRAARQAAAVLFLFEQELRPLSAATRSLLDEIRNLSSQASHELMKAGAVVQRVELISERIGRLVGLAGSVGRVGQIVGAVSGVKKGMDVFLARLLTRNKLQ